MTDIIESRREPHEPIWRDAIDEIEALRAEVERLRDALEEIRNRSSIAVMRSDQSDQPELEVALADICLFVDVVLWKED